MVRVPLTLRCKSSLGDLVSHHASRCPSASEELKLRESLLGEHVVSIHEDPALLSPGSDLIRNRRDRETVSKLGMAVVSIM